MFERYYYIMRINDLKVMLLPTKIYTVDDKLLRGSAIFFPAKIQRLKKQGVTKIVDLRNHEKIGTVILKKLEAWYCKLFNMKYENFESYISVNHVPDQDYYDKVSKIIADNNGKVYMHCHYGQHRTNMAIAMYEKYNKKDNEIIVTDLMKNFWEGEDRRKHPKNQKALELFMKKFFPA